ncbi:MBL fold metallo-hydrolase [Pseudoalteromonas mariniglutinosa]|uniref:MBL fold metallo-hydrolase n=1 Tax=Pseudoalteromonas mariniglutinosa TaxID=206042 RepID=UPI0038507EDC
MALCIHSFFHQQSATICYLVACQASKQAMLIDAPADFDLANGELSFSTAHTIINYINDNAFSLQWIVETHTHADHISAASYLQQKLQPSHPCQLGIGEGICLVQQYFSQLYALEMPCNGAPFDHLFTDQSQFQLGEYTVEVLATAGHTLDSVCYLIAGNAFVGDTFFMPDSGTARCDFPGGSAIQLYESLQRILALPDETQLWMCHDYQPAGRKLAHQTTVAEQRAHNIHMQGNKAHYIRSREQRDATLSVPKLLHPAIQMNIRAGQLPAVNTNKQRFLTIPLTVLL